MQTIATASAAALAAAFKTLRPAVPKSVSRSMGVLLCVRVVAGPEGLELGACDLDVSVAVRPEIVAAPGALAALFPADALGNALKACAKVKGAIVDLAYNADAKALVVMSGRSRFSIAEFDAPDGLPFLSIDPATIGASWEGAPADLTPDASGCAGYAFTKGQAAVAKALAGHCKAAKLEAVTFDRRDPENDGDDALVRVVAGNVTTVLRIAPAPFGYSAKRDPYSYGIDEAAYSDAAAYLRVMRATLGLPLVGEGAPRLIVHEGRAVGLAVGEGRRDYDESRPAPDFTPPAGAEIRDDGGIHVCTVDGVEFCRIGRGGDWHMRYRAPNPGAIVYPEGAYCLPMPIDQRRPVSAVTVNVEGEALGRPLRLHTNGQLELTAEQVAELCGPVDPSTFVEIEPIACHGREIIARGADALRWHAMVERFNRNARKALKNCRTSAETNLTAMNIGISWRDHVDAFRASLEAVAVADDAALAAVANDEPPADPAETIAAPVEEPAPMNEPAPVTALRHHVTGAIERGEAVAIVAIDAAPAAPEPEPAPIETPAAPASDDLAARLERLERMLGVVAPEPVAKRSRAHAAAIRRAWAARREARRQRAEAADWQAIAEANAAAVDASRAEAGRLAERVRRLETIASDAASRAAAEYAPELERLASERDAAQARADSHARAANGRGAAKRRLSRRAAGVRLELARTRAERDGLAHSVSVMASRAAVDAATIERLERVAGPDAERRPGFILASR